ncbi:MAG: ABC transporter substrate-binding protein, partial [Armatimonadota bacterium]
MIGRMVRGWLATVSIALATTLVLLSAGQSNSAPGAPALDEWVVAFSEDITSVDPAVEAGGAIRYNVSYHVFEPLIGVEGPNLQLVPRLAESWRYLDESTLEMRLRRNVRFHNGDEFTADDVLHTYEFHKATASLGSGYVFDPVERLERVDSHTIRFITKGPVASLIPNMAQIFFILPKARRTMGAAAFGRRPFGTGMYRLTGDWSLGQEVRLVANDGYWGGAPTPKRLVFKFIREPSTRVAEMLKGTVHVAETIALPQIPVLRRGVNTDVIAMKGARILFQSINLSKPPFNNVKVRQAMNHAIDRDVVVKSLLENFGQPHAGLFSPGWMGYSSALRPYTFDIARARQLLAEAGLSSGFEFEWQMTDGVFTKDREIAEAVASQLRQAGITARLRVTERATIFQNMFAGNFDVISGQWPTTSDPDRY